MKEIGLEFSELLSECVERGLEFRAFNESGPSLTRSMIRYPAQLTSKLPLYLLKLFDPTLHNRFLRINRC